MTIVLNGSPRVLPEATNSIAALLKHLEVGDHPVIVERNGRAVLRRDRDTTPVADGDVVEIVRMVAGG